MIRVNGQAMADVVLESVAARVAARPTPPVLLTVLVGGTERDRRYIALKEDACRRTGILWQGAFLPADCAQSDLETACSAPADGVFVQLPLPAGLHMPTLPNDVDDCCTARAALLVLRTFEVPLTTFCVSGTGHYACADIARLLSDGGALPVPLERADIAVLAGDSSDVREGAAVLDLVGALPAPPPHLSVYAPPRGCLGPLTVALLLENVCASR